MKNCLCLIALLGLVLAATLDAQTYTFSTFASSSGSYDGVAVDAAGNLYATSYYRHIVLKITPAGIVTILAGQTYSSGSTDGIGGAARFNSPRGIALDSTGNLYVADSLNQTIRKITPAGMVTTLAGLAGNRGSDDGSGASARFGSPDGVVVDSSGNVYVADAGNHTIRKITPAGVVTTLAGLAGSDGAVDGSSAAARFRSPRGVALDSAGNLYVADFGNHAIRKLSPAGVVTTLAGLLESSGATDGVGSTARFNGPCGVAVDSAGNLYIADASNYTVRKLTPAGVVTTLAGLAGASGQSNGTGSAARFYSPVGIALDAVGTLYVVDSASFRLGVASSQVAVTVQPPSQTVAAGATIALTVTATGGEPLRYQWQKNGTNIAGATGSSLALPNVQASDAATYTVAVANSLGTVTSVGAVLSVVAALANNNFADAQNLVGTSGQVTGHNNGATGEPAEPTHYFAAATASSVWYRWTPTQSGTAVLDYSATGFYPVLAVYTGSSLATLTRVAQSYSSRMSFAATAGTTYYLAIGSSVASSRGNFTLAWHIIANDNFANAQVLAGDAGQVTGNNIGATGEPGEPTHFNSSGTASSIWYRWTPSQSGLAIFDTAGSNFSTVLAVYTGDSVSALSRLAQDYNSNPAVSAYVGQSRVVFAVNAGTTYAIAVGGYYSSGNVVLNWQSTQLPVIVTPPVISATQPTNQSSSASIAVPVGNTVTVNLTALSIFPSTVQWQHDNTPIASVVSGFTLTLANVQLADAGNYRAVISNAAGSVVSNSVGLIVLVPPVNDNFAGAQALSGLSGSVTGTNVNATGETDEPIHWNVFGTASSVWYRWTAPASGLAAIDTVGSSFDTVLAVYSGSTLGTLTRLTQDDDSGGGRTSLVNFAATAGTTYYFAVGGSTSGARGALVLNWQLSVVLAISVQPVSQTVGLGGSATFSVTATGSSVTYQWSRNGVPIPGATSSTLTIGNIQGGADASYTVTVSSGYGSVTSSPAALAVAAPALSAFNLRHTRTGAGTLWNIAGGGGQIVAVGDNGTILSSTDGLTWTPRDSGTNAWIVGVTYGAGQFVAVADGGLILTSPDGVVWTPVQSSGTLQRLNNVIYADGKFVVVGEAGTILTSTDARVWTPRASGVTTWLYGLAYNTTIKHFAASGESGVILYSADGATWNRLPVDGLTAHIQAIVAVDSYAQFVAIGHEGVCVSVHQNQLVLKTGESLVTWSGEVSNTGNSSWLVGLVTGANALFANGDLGRIITAMDSNGPWYTLDAGTTSYLLGSVFYNDTVYIVGQDQTILQSEPLYSSRLLSISTRGQVGTGQNMMISGFAIDGTEPKQVLIRAAGPSLASFGLTGTLAAPALTLYDSASRPVASNTGWSSATNAAAIATAAARVGAFPFAAQSADSAILVTLNPGFYTAQITGANGTTGLSLVEVYDADPLNNTGSRATSISTRGIAGPGQNRMIAGFVIGGASARRVMIRAVGPTLSAYGLSGTLAEPQIELYNGSGRLQLSAGAWSLQPDADEIRSAAQTTRAFALPEGSKDAVLLATLLPGIWTVQVSGAGDATGLALVEVYALP